MKKIGILTAMPEEAEKIIHHYTLQKDQELKNISYYTNDQIVLAVSGVGKIQASIATTYMILNYQPDYLINIGIAGNMKGSQFAIGDVFLIDQVIQHDVYLPFEGNHLNYIKSQISLPFSPILSLEENNFSLYKKGLCLTGDQFIDDTKKVSTLNEKFNAVVIEMEAFAFSSVAREFGKIDKTIVVKSISDGADIHAQNAHMDNLTYAMDCSLCVLKNIIKNLD